MATEKKSEIRSLLGLTQAQAAQLLGVTRAQFSMYECGKRSLPTEAMVKYSKYVVYITQMTPTPKSISNELSKKEIQASMDLLLEKYHLKQVKLERSVKKIKKTYQKAIALEQILLLEQKNTTKQNGALVDQMMKEVQEKMKKNNRLIQLEKELEIDSLKSLMEQLHSKKAKLL